MKYVFCFFLFFFKTERLIYSLEYLQKHLSITVCLCMCARVQAEYTVPCAQCSAVDWGISDEGRFYCRSCHNVIEVKTSSSL